MPVLAALSDAQAIRAAEARLARLMRIKVELDELPGFFGHYGPAFAEVVNALQGTINYRKRLVAERKAAK